MKRTFSQVLFRQNEEAGYRPGDDAAHRLAAALADRFDAPTLAAVGDVLAFLERVGGQFHCVSLREKFSAGERVDEDAEGEWETAGLLFTYESRDARVLIAEGPKDFGGVPVGDFSEPPTQIPLQPDDLRDEIEQEVKELEERETEDAAA